jgi:hypothetical protein
VVIRDVSILIAAALGETTCKDCQCLVSRLSGMWITSELAVMRVYLREYCQSALPLVSIEGETVPQVDTDSSPP